MDALVVEVDGQETDHSETYHLGKDLDGSMDADHVGLWDIVLTLVQWFHHFRQVPIYKRYGIKRSFLRNNSRTFRIACGALRNDCRRFKSENKM